MGYDLRPPEVPQCHEHRPRNRCARHRHARMAPSPARKSRNRIRGNRDQRIRRGQAPLVRPRGSYGACEDRRRRRSACRRRHGRDRDARRSRRFAHPRAIRRRLHFAQSRPDARLRPRWPHGDVARRGEGAERPAQFRRHRVFHFSACGGERGWRPRDGGGGTVRTLSGSRGIRHAQLAAASGRLVRDARGTADGRI